MDVAAQGAPALPGPRLGAIHAPLRPSRRPCADRSAASRKAELATPDDKLSATKPKRDRTLEVGPPGFEPGGTGRRSSNFRQLRGRIGLGDKLATNGCSEEDISTPGRSRSLWRFPAERESQRDLRIETPWAATAVVHSENVNEIFTNRVVDAVGEPMEASATHTTVRNDVRLGMPDDPPEAGFQGAKEGGAELESGASPRPMPDALAHVLPGRTARRIRVRLGQPPLELLSLFVRQRECFVLIGDAVPKLLDQL